MGARGRTVELVHDSDKTLQTKQKGYYKTPRCSSFIFSWKVGIHSFIPSLMYSILIDWFYARHWTYIILFWESWVLTSSLFIPSLAPLMVQMIKNLPAIQGTWVWSSGQEDPPEKGKVAYYSILAWRIPWIEEPGGLQSMGSQRVRHDWAANTSTLFTFFFLSDLNLLTSWL